MIWVSSPNHFTLNHLLGLIFLAWSAFTLLWTANPLDGASSLIQLSIAAMAFVLGARSPSLRPILGGLALGIAVSSLIVLFQIEIPGQIISTKIEGLFGNRDMLAETAAMVLVGCIGYRLWWAIPGLLPSLLITPMARAALIATGIAGLVWGWYRYPKLIKLLALLSFFVVLILINARPKGVLERWDVWTDAVKGLTLVGHGLGSFQTLFPFLTHHFDGIDVVVDHPHNDLLEIWFETGFVGFTFALAWIAITLGSADNVSRGILTVFFAVGMFAFPIHVPTALFLAALAAGHAARRGFVLWGNDHSKRFDLRPWYERGDEPEGAY
jgi:hypothetical protein